MTAETIQGRKLFKDGNYSRKYGIHFFIFSNILGDRSCLPKSTTSDGQIGAQYISLPTEGSHHKQTIGQKFRTIFVQSERALLGHDAIDGGMLLFPFP